jgi:hypothetical protein
MSEMSVFVVVRRLPGLTPVHLRALQRALLEAARRLAADGEDVRYIRSIYVPSRGQCLCIFHADSSDVVARANEVAQVPFTRVEEAVDVSAPPL